MPTQTNFLLLFLCNLKESHPAIFSHIIGHSTIVTLIYRSLDKETKRLIMSILNAKKYVDETISYTKLNTLNIIDLFNGADGCYIKINQNFRQILLNNFSQIQFTRNIKTTPIEFNSKLLANQKDTCTNAISIHEHYSEIGLLDSGSRLTSKGLEFLLLSKNEQMWYIITSFMRRHISDNEAGIEYLVEWAMILNGVYDYMEVTNTFSMLDEIGIIKIDGDSYRVNSTILFGTAVAANRFIYLETNYKLYAYTDDPCDIEILNLFSRTVSRLPGMIKGVLDEQKVANALDRQIEAEQLIKYLERHTVKSNNENVINQIRIWRNKRNRISRETGYLYDEFDNYNEYRNYIEKAGTDGIIYKNDEERMIFSRRRIV